MFCNSKLNDQDSEGSCKYQQTAIGVLNSSGLRTVRLGIRSLHHSFFNPFCIRCEYSSILGGLYCVLTDKNNTFCEGLKLVNSVMCIIAEELR